jgi:hypothetical protein
MVPMIFSPEAAKVDREIMDGHDVIAGLLGCLAFWAVVALGVVAFV